MFFILYNPMSNAGKALKTSVKFNKKLLKKGYQTKMINLLEDNDYQALVADLKAEDILVIFGGDGTLHQIVNNDVFNSLNNKIYMYRSGRGNDFARGNKGKFFEITNLVKNLPKANINGTNHYFLNGLGIGIDALTCKKQADNFLIGKKESYFKIAFKAFFRFKPFDIDVEVDGKVYHYHKVWFFVVQNGKYFGGGMKISPKSERLDNKLEFVVIHSVGFKRLLTIFPLIFIGKHTIAKKYVNFLTGEKFKFNFNYHLLQIDGEVIDEVKSLEVTR